MAVGNWQSINRITTDISINVMRDSCLDDEDVEDDGPDEVDVEWADDECSDDDKLLKNS